MARQVKNAERWHKFTARNKHIEGISEVVVNGTGKRCYLWFGRQEYGVWHPGYISGHATLRKLAKAILKEVGSCSH